MRRLLAIGLLISGCGVLGCWGSLPPAPPPAKDATKLGPHGGIAYALPDELGYAEFVNEPPPEERGNRASTSIVVYFLGPDAKAAVSANPTGVGFVANAGKNSAKTVALKAEPRPEDPAGAGRFVSAKGPYRVEDLRGDLTATVGGKPVKVAVVGGR